EELADGGMEAVAQRVDEGPGRPPAYRGAERQARERGRAAVAVALRPHLALADRGRTAAEGRGRIVLEAEDGDLVRLELSSQRLVRREACEPGADDRDGHLAAASGDAALLGRLQTLHSTGSPKATTTSPSRPAVPGRSSAGTRGTRRAG